MRRAATTRDGVDRYQVRDARGAAATGSVFHGGRPLRMRVPPTSWVPRRPAEPGARGRRAAVYARGTAHRVRHRQSTGGGGPASRPASCIGGPSSASRSPRCMPSSAACWTDADKSLAPPLAGAPGIEGPETDEHVTRRLEVVRLVIAGAVAVLALSSVAALLDGSVTWVDLLDAALVMVLGTGLLVHDRLTAMLAERRHSRELGMTRILQGLSRSMSPDAVVEAIVAELRSTSGADHVVVARVRRPDHVVEVTLVTARANVPPSRTWLRPEVPELSSDAVGPMSCRLQRRSPRPWHHQRPWRRTPRSRPTVQPRRDRRSATSRRPRPSADPTAPADARPDRSRGDRPPGPLRLRPALHADRTAGRGAALPGCAHPVPPDPRAMGGSRASAARLGRPGGRRGLLPGVHPGGRRAGRQPRCAHRAAQPALLRRAAGHHGSPAPGHRQPGHHDDRHRPFQAAQRPVRARPG